MEKLNKWKISVTPWSKDSKNRITVPLFPFKTCQYIIGDPKHRMFCGEPVNKTSYCARHEKVCFVKIP